MYKQIGILTGGGDAPGLNAAIRAVVRTAIGEFGMKCIGIEDSFEGILGETHTVNLNLKSVSGILPRGGTILGTRNRGSFVKMVDGKQVFPQMPIGEALANLDILGIEALVAIGGEGTLAIAEQFHKRGFPVIGVPKTIDNDLAATELTFGFMTAIDIATEALDRLHTTAASHDRVMVLEVMGRNTGWIALHAGLAGSADVILIPEIPYSFESIVRKVQARENSGSRFTNIVVAEGAIETGKSEIYQDNKEMRLGGVGNYIGTQIEKLTGKETRTVVLGHLQRGGSPNAFDRMLGTNFGACAVRALASGDTGKMVALQAGTVVTVPLSEACANIKTVAIGGQLVRTARDIGISFAAPKESKMGEEAMFEVRTGGALN
ncbi:MAG: ATP-dependent 6-phosphofructokinase [Acidobacteria bacterium]|nr:ATP-dependent 6-phosphofructokinase [Acidobacteriota bacterium]MBP7473670.1 ATP-dependent 6-phosphofructokinase [Pyrinomonadaceae bacterium]MBP9110383.1 ATP-dependent 6-phosphofructokinase [Pyrinomonadaceae bacterium]